MNVFLEKEKIEKKEATGIFYEMLEDVQCEKFIAVGHILESMIRYDTKKSNYIMNALIYLYTFDLIDDEDIKHG